MERRLLRPSAHLHNSYADVVSVIPTLVHKLLPSESVCCGRIDSRSGLALLSLRNGEIWLWKSIECTLTEPLYPPDDLERYVHPKKVEIPESLIAIVSRGSQSYHSLYVCDPDGMLCSWNSVFLRQKQTTDQPPDGTGQIKLSQQPEKEKEKVSILADLSSNVFVDDENDNSGGLSNGYGGVIVGTSYGRIFVAKKSFGVNIDIKELHFENHSESSTSLSNMLGRMLYRRNEHDVVYAPEKSVVDVLCVPLGKQRHASPQKHKYLKTEQTNCFLTIYSNFQAILWSLQKKQSTDDLEDITHGIDSLLKGIQSALWENIKSSSPENEKQWVEGQLSADHIKLTTLCKAATFKTGNTCIAVLAVRVFLPPSLYRVYLVQFAIKISNEQQHSDDSSFITLSNVYWLNKYSNDTSKVIKCCGLDISSPGCSDFIIYSAWQQPSMLDNISVPLVTVSAIYVLLDDVSKNGNFSNTFQNWRTSCYDLELPNHIVPALLGVGKSAQTNGLLIISQSGCIVDTRIKTTNRLSEAPVDTEGVASVETLTNHLLSSFDIYQKNKEAHAKLLSKDIPPSLACSPMSSLDSAVCNTSMHLLNEYSKGAFSSSLNENDVPLSSSWIRTDFLREKLNAHNNFCNFLHHACIWNRISFSCKNKIADHGEMLAACIQVIPVIENCVKTLPQHFKDVGVAKFTLFLDGIVQTCTNVVEHLQTLHDTLLLQRGRGESKVTFILQLTEILATLVSATLQYRKEQSDILYYLPERLAASAPNTDAVSLSLWTESTPYRELAIPHLRLLNNDDVIVPSSYNSHIELLCTSLLDSFLPAEKSSYGEAAERYSDLKIISKSLLLKHSSAEKTLVMCVEHSYFDGILDLCYSIEKDCLQDDHEGEYSLTKLLRNQKIIRQVDLKSGLTFPQFVLKWFADRKMYGHIFHYGKNCSSDLQHFLKNNRNTKIASLKWIEDFRNSDWNGAKLSLLSSMVADKNVKRYQSSTEKKFLLSLAKVASKVDLAQSREASSSVVVTDAIHKDVSIQNALDLIKCQEILEKIYIDDFGNDKSFGMLTPEELISIASTMIASFKLSSDSKRIVGLVGISLAELIPIDSSLSSRRDFIKLGSVVNAGKIWKAIVETEMNSVWHRLIDRFEFLTEEEIRNEVSDSLFFHVANQLHISKHKVNIVKKAEKGFDVDSGVLDKMDLSYAMNPKVQKYVCDEISKKVDDKNLHKLLTICGRMAMEIDNGLEE